MGIRMKTAVAVVVSLAAFAGIYRLMDDDDRQFFWDSLAVIFSIFIVVAGILGFIFLWAWALE